MRWKIKTRDASLAGNSTTRVVHAVGTALAVGTVSALLLVQPTYAASIQNFDTDPGWTRFNNPANSNDFGFQDSNLAGGTAGEAGGFFSVTNVPVWYGDESVGNFGGNDALSASGILNIVSVDADYNNVMSIGHFDSEGFGPGRQNGIGFSVLESEDQIGTSEFRIVYVAGTGGELLFTIVDSLDRTRTWSYNYDPNASSFGSLTVSVSGPGGGTATHFLTSGERGSIGSIDTFGLFGPLDTNLVSTAQAEIYVDNLSYTSSTTAVTIDIMPNSDGNNLNLRAGSGASISVAVLSVSEFFDAPNLIDPSTLKFGPGEASISGGPRARDVDGDGDEDLVVKFLTNETGIACGDTSARLSGFTFDLEPISGSDATNTFNCPRIRKRH